MEFYRPSGLYDYLTSILHTLADGLHSLWLEEGHNNDKFFMKLFLRYTERGEGAIKNSYFLAPG